MVEVSLKCRERLMTRRVYNIEDQQLWQVSILNKYITVLQDILGR